jgi:hypothetical protein
MNGHVRRFWQFKVFWAISVSCPTWSSVLKELKTSLEGPGCCKHNLCGLFTCSSTLQNKTLSFKFQVPEKNQLTWHVLHPLCLVWLARSAVRVTQWKEWYYFAPVRSEALPELIICWELNPRPLNHEVNSLSLHHHTFMISDAQFDMSVILG